MVFQSTVSPCSAASSLRCPGTSYAPTSLASAPPTPALPIEPIECHHLLTNARQ
jgi:hypothetical protein